MLFSEEEFDCLLQSNPDHLIVLEAGLTWCRPCKGFERTFQVRSSGCSAFLLKWLRMVKDAVLQQDIPLLPADL